MFFNSLCEEYPFHAHSKFSAICKRKPPNYFGKLMKEIYAGMQQVLCTFLADLEEQDQALK